MPEVRDDSRVSRRWRLPALLTSIALVGGATMLRTTVERLHDQVCEVRRLRARLAERRRELERRRQELVTVATAVDGLVPVARALASRETAICQDRTFAETGDASPGPASEATSHAEDDAATRTPRAIAMLSWVEAQLANAGNAFAAQAALIRQRAQEARSVPTLWPVRGTVTSPFGWRSSPYGYGLEWHPGVDIQAAYGTPVRAAADGEVVFAGSARGYGALVVLDHGAALTRYAHLSAIWVRAGQAVVRGEGLGALGGTGRATAPHLHYEVRVGGEALDPECLLADEARTTLVRGDRRSHACTLARARLEQRRPTERDAADATASAGGAG